MTEIGSEAAVALTAAASRLQAMTVSDLFEQDATRVAAFSRKAAGLHLDFSKQRLDQDALNTLLGVAKQFDLSGAFKQLTEGAPLNITERRAALHTLLRGTAAETLATQYSDVRDCLARMRLLVDAVHSGGRRGHSGSLFSDVVNIGIGGSDLGPRMVCRALDNEHRRLRAHFISNVDPHDLDTVLADLNPATTLIIVCSKTFTTEETLTNALRARQWLTAGGVSHAALAQHVLAVTTNLDAAAEFGIDIDQCYPMWDWVGGRYSLWSAIGLIIALHSGWGAFEALLAGANAMDEHALSTPYADNMPMLLALFELWNTHYLGAETHVVLPYSQRLEKLAEFLQQLTMESNGKRVNLEGQTISAPTAPVLWGSAGTIGQHSYYQLLHQGNREFSADLIMPLTNGDVDLDAHRKLAANAFAQSRAFMIGRSTEDAQALAASRQQPELAPHFEMPGSHPHSLLWCDAITPATLGALIAAYEHKTFFLSRLLNVNAFDQWGVELGKVIGRQIRGILETGDGIDALDPSTAAAARAWITANRA